MLGKLSNFSGPLTGFILQNNTSRLILKLDGGITASYPGSGDIWYDLSGNNNNFILNGSTTSVYENNSLYFDPTYNQYGTASDIGTLSKFTINTWFNLKSFPLNNKNPQIITNAYEYPNHNYVNFAIGFLNGNPIGNTWNTKLSGGFFSGESWFSTDGFQPNLNTWYNVALTYDKNHLKLYVNGNIYSSIVCNTPILSSGLGLYIGKRWDYNEFINADISIIEIWDNALNSSQILNNFNLLKYRFFNTSRYFRLIITKIKDNSNLGGATQMDDFILKYNNNIVNWNIDATASNPDGVYSSQEGPSNLLDNSTSTKWCNTNFINNSEIATIYIDNTIPITFDSYYYVTGNDYAGRDPISWSLAISNDNSTWIVIDTQTNVAITDSRSAATQIFTIN